MSFSLETLKSKKVFALVALGLVTATAGVTALLVNIFERKSEARRPYVRLVEVTEDTTDPAQWGVNWPKEYDTYKLTALSTRTRFGGHGGSEAMPQEKMDRDPWLKRMFAGYAFAIDYRDRRGHAYMLSDQEKTERLTKPQSGSCLHCHASIMPLYRKLGDGDAMKGFEASHKLSYQEASKQLHDMGNAHPVSCVDCHDPKSMKLRVTRPASSGAFSLSPLRTRRRRTCPPSNAGAPATGGRPTTPTRWPSRRKCAPSSAGNATWNTIAGQRRPSPSPGARACAPRTWRTSGTAPRSRTASRSSTTNTPRRARPC
jgi:formate-dependent nitrite reductase cytochrome c552 subunit